MERRYDCNEATDRATGLREAASAVRRGELVALPTDTVYGLGADAFGSEAVADLLGGPDEPAVLADRLLECGQPPEAERVAVLV